MLMSTDARLVRDAARPLHGRLTRELGVELHRQGGRGGEAAGQEAAAAGLADTMLADAVRERATDVHFDPQEDGVRVRFRIDGALFDSAVLTREQGERIVRHFKVRSGLDTAGGFRPGDARLRYAVDGRGIDLRLACAPSVCGEKLAIRLLDPALAGRPLGELGLSDPQRVRVEHWLTHTAGMFLVAGPTGSGKTTTLYALLHELKLRERSVVTIEDPVEYQVEGVVQMQVDRRHGLTFEEGLRSMLRLDPDYLLLGEVRDAGAARAAVEAAASGRVLMSTVHSRDAVGVVTVLRNYGLSDHEIATSLRVVVGQRLARRLCRKCSREAEATDEEYQWLASAGLPAAPPARFHAPVGCDACRGLGYEGRVGVFEVWRPGQPEYEDILAHADERLLRRRASAAGLRSLVHDAFVKATAGVTSLAEVKAIAASCPACEEFAGA